MILYELIGPSFESPQMRQAGFQRTVPHHRGGNASQTQHTPADTGGEASKAASGTRQRLAGMLKRELMDTLKRSKARDERYESAVALSEDIRRYLRGDACRRTRDIDIQTQEVPASQCSGFLVAVIVFLTLLVGLYFALWQLDKAEEQNRPSGQMTDQEFRRNSRPQAPDRRSSQEETRAGGDGQINRALITARENSSRSTTSRIFSPYLAFS